jgi:hypothetical protein
MHDLAAAQDIRQRVVYRNRGKQLELAHVLLPRAPRGQHLAWRLV